LNIPAAQPPPGSTSRSAVRVKRNGHTGMPCTPAERTTTMPKPTIVLDKDQADDLRELVDLTAIVHEWLEHAAGHILNDLAGFAYPHTFHPRSYAHWLTEDLASIATRLQQATNLSCDPLDTLAT
jgi:hypothetical protein